MQEDHALPDAADGLHVRVSSLENRFEKLVGDMNTSFEKVNDNIQSAVAGINARFDVIGQNREASLGKILGVAGLVATVATFVVGGFVSFAKINLDTNITYTNQRIDSTDRSVDKLAVATKDSADKLASSIRDLMNGVIPRPELESRIGANRDAIKTISERQDAHSTDIAKLQSDGSALKADVERLKTDSLKREDLDGRFADFTKRLDLISNRVERLQTDSAGSAVLQEQVKSLGAQVAELRSRLLAAPKYLVHPDGS